MAKGFPPFVDPHLSTFFVPSAQAAHSESGLHHSAYPDAAWPSGHAGVGRQYRVGTGQPLSFAANPAYTLPRRRVDRDHAMWYSAWRKRGLQPSSIPTCRRFPLCFVTGRPTMRAQHLMVPFGQGSAALRKEPGRHFTSDPRQRLHNRHTKGLSRSPGSSAMVRSGVPTCWLQACSCSARTRRVVYPGAADNLSGPLPFRLRRLNQPVISTRNGFSASHPPPLACF